MVKWNQKNTFAAKQRQDAAKAFSLNEIDLIFKLRRK